MSHVSLARKRDFIFSENFNYNAAERKSDIPLMLKHFKGSFYSWKGVINLEETHGHALK